MQEEHSIARPPWMRRSSYAASIEHRRVAWRLKLRVWLTLAFSCDTEGTNAHPGSRLLTEGRMETAQHGAVTTGQTLVPHREESPLQ